MFANVRRLSAWVYLMALTGLIGGGCAEDVMPPEAPTAYAQSFDLTGARVVYEEALGVLVFEQTVTGAAGAFTPIPAGQVDGAPVLGYVFVTSLAPEDVGFGAVEGTVALAVTSHPDFDDTPLWDENSNRSYDDDGVVYHTHWVVLVPDDRAPGGLSVKQAPASESANLPPTAPMAMYLDSPGYGISISGSTLRVTVPRYAVRNRTNFSFDAVTALMRVDASGTLPRLAVEEVYDVLSGDLSLPYAVETQDAPVAEATQPGFEAAFDLETAEVNYRDDLDAFVFSQRVTGVAGSQIPTPAGQVDGAPVWGYVFPTTLAPTDVGFGDVEGIVALAATTHPDFDDTPYWDEDGNQSYEDDGAIYHTHWVVLESDVDSAAGLSVKRAPADETHVLPPTAPMPMYLDSPGFGVTLWAGTLHITVPRYRVGGKMDFQFDAVTARMRVDATNGPVLRVIEVFDVLSGDLSLPFRVQN